MKFINCKPKSAFLIGALTAGAFVSGMVIGLIVNREKILTKLRKTQFKENINSSSK